MKFGGNVIHGPRKKPLDYGVNPDRITLLSSPGYSEGYG